MISACKRLVFQRERIIVKKLVKFRHSTRIQKEKGGQ